MGVKTDCWRDDFGVQVVKLRWKRNDEQWERAREVAGEDEFTKPNFTSRQRPTPNTRGRDNTF